MTIKAETKSNNIHVFRVNREAKNKDLSTNTISPVTVNSRTSLSAETKRLICEDHIENPKYTQEALAKKYGCKRTTIAKIIKSKERWLSIESDTATAKRFRQRSSRYPVVENAVILWLQKEHNSDITLVSDQMLRYQARQYAQAFHVEGSEEFKASSSWVLNFKQRYMNQKVPRIESSPASTLILENDHNKASPDTPMSDVSHHANDPRPLITPIDTNNNKPAILNNTENSFIENEVSTTRPSSPLPVTFHSADSSPIAPQNSIEENTKTYNIDEDDLMEEEPEYECTAEDHCDTDDPCGSIEPLSFKEIVKSKVTTQVEDSDTYNNDTPDGLPEEIETVVNELQQEQTKLRAKQHLEAALAFYTSQKSPQSMSADMIKLILQNDF